MLGPFADAMMVATLRDGLRPVPSPAAKTDAPPDPADVTAEPRRGLRRRRAEASPPRPGRVGRASARLRGALGALIRRPLASRPVAPRPLAPRPAPCGAATGPGCASA